MTLDDVRFGLEIFGIIVCAYFGVRAHDFKTVLKCVVKGVELLEDNERVKESIKKETPEKIKKKSDKLIQKSIKDLS